MISFAVSIYISHLVIDIPHLCTFVHCLVGSIHKRLNFKCTNRIISWHKEVKFHLAEWLCFCKCQCELHRFGSIYTFWCPSCRRISVNHLLFCISISPMVFMGYYQIFNGNTFCHIFLCIYRTDSLLFIEQCCSDNSVLLITQLKWFLVVFWCLSRNTSICCIADLIIFSILTLTQSKRPALPNDSGIFTKWNHPVLHLFF